MDTREFLAQITAHQIHLRQSVERQLTRCGILIPDQPQSAVAKTAPDDQDSRR